MDDYRRIILLDEQTIAARIKEMGREITRDHPEGDLLFVGILKGSFIFLADLVRAVDIHCEIDFARISSYGGGTVSKGQLDILLDVGARIKDRNVILVDDIVDTALTLSQYKDVLASREPRSLRTAALIDKTERRETELDLDYRGFHVESGFLVGFGLDCAEQYRNLSGIYTLEKI